MNPGNLFFLHASVALLWVWVIAHYLGLAHHGQ